MKILLYQKKCFYEIFKLLYDEILNFQIRKFSKFSYKGNSNISKKTNALKNFQKGDGLEGEKLL